MNPALRLLLRRRKADPSLAYINTIVNTYGATEVWPLVDIASGTTITASQDSARNGTLTGWDLQNSAGPITGTFAPYSDGTNDYGDIDSASLVSIFDGAVGGAHLCCNFPSGAWTDGTARILLKYVVDADNYVEIRKSNTNNRLTFYYRAGGTTETQNQDGLSTAGWFDIGVFWDRTGSGDVTFYYNGAVVTAALSIGGVWSGSIDTALIGAANTTPGNVTIGHLAYCSLWSGSTLSSADVLAIHNLLVSYGMA